MRKFFSPCFLLSLCILFLCSCKDGSLSRTVSIIIPEHPWETQDVEKMWYSLQWSDGSCVRTLFVDNGTRNVQLKVPLGANIIVCAYPVDDLMPFGALISPAVGEAGVVLDQDTGFLADLLLGIELEVACSVNFDMLVKYSSRSTSDFRLLDADVLLTDILNGRLSERSFRVLEPVEASDLLFYPGIWESESVHENALAVGADGVVPVLELGRGVHRYLCVSRQLEIRIVVSQDGIFKYERPALISRLT